ncbi:hypothetical protein [Sandarakinorhabdus sp.]|uniref:hypothetical protein n=1 Tax=Sandarakinorhabdus sp. TaxID=1916663 RepID=UPI00333F2766
MLRAHPDFSETWVQGLIAEDPAILGLGDLVLRDRERIQPRAGRLDLLLQDVETKRRYEVELQLGATDESHIIRTIEYWDIERKRYPQYDHCAVIIAEDITSRFLNIIALFNGAIPLIAIQMQALRVGEHLTMNFTTVINELTRGLVDEDEDAQAAPADRAYWEDRSSPQMLQLTDNLFKLVKQYDQSLELKYTKFYVGITRAGQPFNFVKFQPQRKSVSVGIRLEVTEEQTAAIEAIGFETQPYDRRYNNYRLRLTGSELGSRAEALAALFELAYRQRTA